MTFGDWLAQLGLSKYAEIFAANAIDFEVLPDLTEADLEKLGLLLGHRKKLLRAARELTPAPVTAAAAPQPATPPAATTADAERRQITVLFSDLVGSTDLSQTIDPELLRDVLAAYQAMATAAIRQAGGTVAKFLGDGVLAYFGYPAANDDDAVRAVRAARAMLAGIAILNAQWRDRLGRDLALRVGVHTGLVVVGDVGSGDARESNAIVGETPNLAARVQGLAAPGTVAISGTTHGLVRRAFSCRPLGIQQAKGIAGGIEIHIVDSEISDIDSDRAAIADIPLVGREQELSLLLDRLRLARAGTGQAVLIGGEAGLGKSRLLRAFRDASGLDGAGILALRGTAQARNSAFYPVIGMLEHRLGFDGIGAESRRARLENRLAALQMARPEIARPLAELLGIDADPGPALEEQRRRRLLGALRRFVIAETADRSHLLVVEDAHWIDGSTLEFLGLLLASLADLRLFVLITFRPEFVPPWPLASHITTLALGHLAPEQIATIVRERAGKKLPDIVLRQLLAKTDGIPLFAEELTQSVVASGAVVERDGRYELAPRGAALAIPSTLRDALTARLDRLSGARGVAQIAAVIGREFPYELLAAVADRDTETLDADLDALIRSDILRQRGVPPHARFSFKHALLQEAAYDVLLRATSRQYHARIAEAYERLLPAEVEAFPEIVAQHCAFAGQDERAVGFYIRAAEQARRRSGLREAIAHFRAALECLSRLPETAARDGTEVDILLRLGPLISATSGVRHAAYREAYDRALALAERHGEDRQRFAAHWGLWFLDQVGTEDDAVGRRMERVGEMFAIAHRLHDPDLELEAYHSRWATRFGHGTFAEASADARAGIKLYVPERHLHHRFTYGGHDTKVCAHAFWGVCAAIAGDGQESATQLTDGLAHARRLDDPPALAHGLAFAALGAHFRGDLATCQALGDEAFEAARVQAVPQFHLTATAIGGWAHYMAGERTRGLDMIESIHGASQQTSTLFSAVIQSLIADIEMAQGRTLVALQRMQNVGETHSRFYRAEYRRRLGELTLLADPSAHAEAARHFQAAIALAHRQEAWAFELRAAFSLARLVAADGRAAEAHALLAPVVARFDADATAPDLAEARRFLATLT